MKTVILLLIASFLAATEIEIEVLGSGGPEADDQMKIKL